MALTTAVRSVTGVTLCSLPIVAARPTQHAHSCGVWRGLRPQAASGAQVAIPHAEREAQQVQRSA